tara:strand:- start:2185 stop:3882 length:1698 start_codon:yes stop_codon:yes gene_type:complete
MFQIAILIVFLTAVISSIVVTTAMTFSHYQTLMSIQRDKINISHVTKLVVNNIKYVNDKKLVPFGVDGENYHELPNWMLFNKNNSFGKPYMYCPYSLDNSLTADDTVLNNDETSYDVEKISNTLTENREYVLASDPAPISNILAFIVSFREDSVYTCNDIIFANNKFQLPEPTDGRVEAITNDSLLASDLRRVEEYSIEQSNDIFGSVIANWNGTQPDKYVISLKAGDIFTLPSGTTVNNSDKGTEKVIYISGENELNKSLINNDNSSSGIDVYFSDVKLILDNLNMIGNFTLNLNNVELIVNNSTLRNINANNSKISLNNTIISGTANYSSPSLILNNSELIFENNGNFVFNKGSGTGNISLISVINSKINSNNTNIQFNVSGDINAIEMANSELNLFSTTLDYNTTTGTPSSFIYGDSTSELNLYYSQIEQERSFSFVRFKGKAVINNSNISMENASNNAIVLDHGSHFEINNTNIVNSINNGNQPIVGIRDLGAQFISGDNNNIYASTCITGDIFNKEEIITITDDTISAVNNDFSIVTTSNEDEFILDIKDYFNKFYYNCL